MLSVCVWKWNRHDGTALFGPEHVNTLRSMLDRHLHMDHRLHCFTNEPEGLDGDIVVHPIVEFLDTPRCRRRMYQYGEHMQDLVGPRMLALDLDVVLTDDVTPLFDTSDPLVLWDVVYAGVVSGSVQLMDTGFLDGLYWAYKHAPDEFPRQASPRGVGSDQAMLNHYIFEWEELAYRVWTEGDGIHTFFGDGYEHLAHHGVSPTSERLPDGCRMVVLGSKDLQYLSLPIFQEHWR